VVAVVVAVATATAAAVAVVAVVAVAAVAAVVAVVAVAAVQVSAPLLLLLLLLRLLLTVHKRQNAAMVLQKGRYVQPHKNKPHFNPPMVAPISRGIVNITSFHLVVNSMG